jgi:hypothetical protein
MQLRWQNRARGAEESPEHLKEGPVGALPLHRQTAAPRTARGAEVPRHKVGGKARRAGFRSDRGEESDGTRPVTFPDPKPDAVDTGKEARGVLSREGDDNALRPQARGGEVGLEGVGEGGDLDQAIRVVLAGPRGERGALHRTLTVA